MASGFDRGTLLERSLRRLAARGPTRLIGPNCVGFVNAHDLVYATVASSFLESPGRTRRRGPGHSERRPGQRGGVRPGRAGTRRQLLVQQRKRVRRRRAGNHPLAHRRSADPSHHGLHRGPARWPGPGLGRSPRPPGGQTGTPAEGRAVSGRPAVRPAAHRQGVVRSRGMARRRRPGWRLAHRLGGGTGRSRRRGPAPAAGPARLGWPADGDPVRFRRSRRPARRPLPVAGRPAGGSRPAGRGRGSPGAGPARQDRQSG